MKQVLTLKSNINTCMKNLKSFMICERMKKTYDKNIDIIITKKL